MSSLVQVTKAIRALTSELTSGQKDLKAEGIMSSSEKADALEVKLIKYLTLVEISQSSYFFNTWSTLVQ